MENNLSYLEIKSLIEYLEKSLVNNKENFDNWDFNLYMAYLKLNLLKDKMD